MRSGAFPGTVTGRLTSGYADVLNQLFTGDYPTWSLGVTVNYPVGKSYEDVRKVQAESRAPPDDAAAREPAARHRGSDPPGRAPGAGTAERQDAARAGATLAEQRLDTG